MKILITGGAGFLGLHLALHLAKDHHISLIDIADYSKDDYPKNCEFYKADVRSVKNIKEILEKERPDVVVHCAAALPLWSRKEIMDTNINGTENMLRLAFVHGVKRFIHISSTAVYGVPDVHPVYEDHKLVGVGPYGESKVAAEEICKKYRQKGHDVVVIRPKTFIGPYRLGIFEILFDWVRDNKPIPIIGSGNNRYQLLAVEDLVEAIRLCILSTSNSINDVFNVGATDFKTVRDDLTEFFASVNSQSRVLKTPAGLVKSILWLANVFRVSPMYQWVYDTADKDSFVAVDKISNITGWRPRYSNVQSLVRAYQWYIEHYKEVKQVGDGLTHRVKWNQGVLGLIKKILR